MSKKRSGRTSAQRKRRREITQSKRLANSGAVWKQSAEEATLVGKPYINAYAVGHGAHGDTKYNRAKEKRIWKRDLQKGASRGSFLYVANMGICRN